MKIFVNVTRLEGGHLFTQGTRRGHPCTLDTFLVWIGKQPVFGCKIGKIKLLDTKNLGDAVVNSPGQSGSAIFPITPAHP